MDLFTPEEVNAWFPLRLRGGGGDGDLHADEDREMGSLTTGFNQMESPSKKVKVEADGAESWPKATFQNVVPFQTVIQGGKP